MTAGSLASALGGVDWTRNVKNSLQEKSNVKRLEACAHRIALWSHEIQSVDPDNPALAFVREMQSSCISAIACLSTGLYKPAAGAMRSCIETALYFTYFSCHPSELTTLIRDERYYVSKRDIIEFHKTHTERFSDRQRDLGFLSNLDRWYSKISAIVHGQIPGVWTSGDLANTAFAKDAMEAATNEMETAGNLINELFLLTCARIYWASLNPHSKAVFIKGLSGKQKTALNLPAV